MGKSIREVVEDVHGTELEEYKDEVGNYFTYNQLLILFIELTA